MPARPLVQRLLGGLRHPVHAVHYRYRRTQAAAAFDRAVRAVARRRPHSLVDRFRRAMTWLEARIPTDGGVPLGKASDLAYPEVTGYMIPSLLAWGERGLAERLGAWLVTQQNDDGSWSDPWGTAPYVFDTGQALRGLLALSATRPDFEPAIRRSADWLAAAVADNGEVVTPSTSKWGVVNGVAAPPAIHLYALAPLAAAGRVLGTSDWAEPVARAKEYYLAGGNPANVDALSHFHGYIVAALMELGEPEHAAVGMAATAARQRHSGAVPGYRNRRWVDTSAMFQYADIWYRLGDADRAEAAFRHGCRLQAPDGGFPGSVGRGTAYNRDDEVSWPIKFFLDALRSKILSGFNDDASRFPNEIGQSDGRLRLVRDALDHSGAASAVDLGCGRGRFLRALQITHPGIGLSGLDVSPEMLTGLPDGATPLVGSVLDLPYPNDSLEFAFCVETLEHAVNIGGAIREMARVIAPGGTLVVIDKNRDNLGQMDIEPWEQWFDADEVAAMLREEGLATTVHRDLPYDERDGSDGLFIGWVGRRS